jgi:hypothetical protein
MNRRLALGLLIVATTAWAQDAAQQQVGGGPDQAKFKVKREANSHPTGSLQPGEALVYVIGDSEFDNTALPIGGLIKNEPSASSRARRLSWICSRTGGV